MIYNKIHKIVLLTIILFHAFAVEVFAEGNEIELMYFNHGDSVSLRWAPTSITLLKNSANRGYVLQRRKSGEKTWQSITEVMKPLSEKEMSEKVSDNHELALLMDIFYETYTKDGKYKQGVNKNDESESNIRSVDGKAPFEEQLAYFMSLVVTDISLPIAKAAALHYVDKNIESNAIYDYRVIWGDDKNANNASVAIVTVNTAIKSVLYPLGDLSVSFYETDALLKWDISKTNDCYSAYIVERSTDSIHFERANARPITHAYAEDEFVNTVIHHDSFPNLDSRYYYRVAGYSPFGLVGPYTKIIGGEPFFNINRVDVKIDTVIVKGKSTEFRWSMDKKYEPKIKGFQISRTTDFSNFDYVNEKMIAPSQRSYKVKGTPNKFTYYTVDLYGFKEGQIKQSSRYTYSYIDSIPPSTPKNLKAIVDTTGKVVLSWNKSPESDVLGYHVYFSNSGEEDDYLSLNDTTYLDTTYTYTIPLNTLTNEIYYKVLAVDHNYHPSLLSDAVKLMKPDTIPPTKVVFDFIKQEKGKILLSWVNSSSVDVSHMLLMRQVENGKLDTLKRFDAKKKGMPTSFEDSPEGHEGLSVQYFMTVYDKADNFSIAHTEALVLEGKRECVGIIKSRIINTDQTREIQLKWNKDSHAPKINRYVVYRKENDGHFYAIASVDTTDMFYNDKNVKVETKYVYYIRAISTEYLCPAKSVEPIVIEAVLKDKGKKKK